MNQPFCFSMFFGLILILFGLSIFINILFGIDIPVGRVCIGILLCYFGYHILTGHSTSWAWSSRHTCSDYKNCNHSTVMGDSTTILDEQSLKQKNPFEYSTTMGAAIIDISSVYPSEETSKIPHTLNISTTMGKTTIKINKTCKVTINANSSLGNVVLPDGSKICTGSHVIGSQTQHETADIHINARTTLGELEIKLV